MTTARFIKHTKKINKTTNNCTLKKQTNKQTKQRLLDSFNINGWILLSSGGSGGIGRLLIDSQDAKELGAKRRRGETVEHEIERVIGIG